MTDSLAALGVLSLVASGQFRRSTSLLILLAMAIAVAMKESWRQQASRRHVDAVLALALVALQAGRAIVGSAGPLDLLIEFAVGLQVIRVATRKGAAHDQQVIVLALLHLIAGTVVGGGLGYGLCFLGLLVVTPGALVLSHLRREVEGNYRQGARDRTGLPVDVPRILRSKRVVGRQFIAVTCLLSIPILLFTVALFVAFPRVGLSLLLLNRPRGGRMIGFSGQVNLGEIGTLRSDPTIVLRVMVDNVAHPPPRKVMHLRGTALDEYTRGSWRQSRKQSGRLGAGGELIQLRALTYPVKPSGMHIELDLIDPPVLFLPQGTVALRAKPSGRLGPGSGIRILSGANGELRYQAPNERGIQYEVLLANDGKPSFTQLPPKLRSSYLQIPDDLPQRIATLAASWVDGAQDDLARAKVIERHLRTDYRYDLSSPSGAADKPLDHFLFESKRGHCEYYSTAMAIMLRLRGIPSRNVTGFVGGTYNRYGKFYAVRQGDAHSWVEAYIAGRGWLTFDPTPPGAAIPQSEIDGALASMRDFFEAISQRWNQHVVGYDLRQQATLLESLQVGDRGLGRLLRKPSSRLLLGLAGVLIALGSGYWLYRRRRRLKPHAALVGNRSQQTEVATALYLALDRTMSTVGAARLRSSPPMHHAKQLTLRGHPNCDEIASLTERYLRARYGEHPFTDSERLEFEQRVELLRQTAADS